MQPHPVASPRFPRSTAGTSRRRRILDYIAAQGGELRSESGQGLRRQISEALGERPTPVSQTLVALEKAGLVEREVDVEHRRCHAIRLVAHPGGTPRRRRDGSIDLRQRPPIDQQRMVRMELQAAERDLADAIRAAAEASRRVQTLRRALARAAGRQADLPDGAA